MKTPSTLRHPHLPKLRLFKQWNGQSENWYGRFRLKGHDYRTSLETTDWTDALARAQKWYHRIQYEVENGIAVAPSTAPTFTRMVKPTLAGMRVKELSEAYIKGVAQNLAAQTDVGRFFGPKRVDQITTRTWDEFRNWLVETRTEEGRRRLSEKSVHQMKNAVRLVLRQAYVDGHLELRPTPINPVPVSPPRLPPVFPRPRPIG